MDEQCPCCHTVHYREGSCDLCGASLCADCGDCRECDPGCLSPGHEKEYR